MYRDTTRLSGDPEDTKALRSRVAGSSRDGLEVCGIVGSRERRTSQTRGCTLGEVTTAHKLLTLYGVEHMWDVVYSIWAYSRGPMGGEHYTMRCGVLM